MRRARITGAILALGLALLVSVGALPASAHPGAIVFQIKKLGVTTSIPVLVPADYGKDINDIEITAPAAFRLTGGSPAAGWKLTQTAETLVFTGGLIPANSPGDLFTVTGVALAKGQLIFPVTTKGPDGSVMHYTGGPTSIDAGVVLYAGDSVPSLPGAHKFPVKAVGGGVIVGIGVAGSIVLLLRRRRTPATG
jgi:hypothetical protein